jgi:hypothetical protein
MFKSIEARRNQKIASSKAYKDQWTSERCWKENTVTITRNKGNNIGI